ncbi:hypothetical protein JXA02_01635 [candidate division KSB1 bacterium]|nr:hypothetical protein [candidate division KSB1 bacterium]RQW10767.1 MAG: hypothetical protein EH222_01740 [candidate division KSB1 bacterium]
MDCCEKMLQQVCDELAEDINSELCEKLKKHLENCQDCREQVESMRSTVNLFQCLKDKKVPRDIHERLLKLLNVEDAAYKLNRR